MLARHRLLSLAVPVVLSLLAACQLGAPVASATLTPANTDLELRSYDVPRAYSVELSNVVGSLLYRGKDAPKAGSVALSPGGQLLVAAPASFHQGVEQMVARLKDAPVSAPPAVEMSYWIVLGRPASVLKMPDGASDEVLPALQQLVDTQGPMELAFLDQLKLRSSSGDHADVESPRMSITQNATVIDDKVLADVRLNHQRGPSKVRARTQLETNKLLVLAEAGYEALPGDPFFDESRTGTDAAEPITAFYILRARVVGK